MADPEVPARVFHVGEEDLGEAVIVTVSGEIDAANVDAVRERLEGWATVGRPHFVVDLRRLTYLDSLGITMLSQAFDRARRAGSSVAVACGERTAELLESLGIDAEVSVVRSRDQALAAAEEASDTAAAESGGEARHRAALRAAREAVEEGRVPPDDEELLRLRAAIERLPAPPPDA